MDILSVAIIAFVVMETVNVGVLYFYPGSRRANGMGVFNAYERFGGLAAALMMFLVSLPGS